MKKKKKWMKFRHKVIIEIIRPIFHLIAVGKYHAKVDRFREQGDRNWLVLSNHQTGFDQFFLGLAFRGPLYYVAMEDLFSNGLISKLLVWAVAPIPIMKASTDAKAVKTCIRVAREGGSIALFPEGNRTYSGRSCYIKPSVASLAKMLGLPIAIMRIEGGYGVRPRWGKKTRKGDMRVGVRRVVEPEEYKDLSNDELYELICRELNVDETALGGSYQSKTLAVGMERAIYVCPQCGISEFETEGDLVTCRHCGLRHRYLPDKTLECLNGESRFRYVADWYEYQESFIRSLDLSPYLAEPVCRERVSVSEVVVYDRKRPVMKDAEVSLFGDRLELCCGEERLILSYDDVRAMACIADHKLNIFYQKKIYQLKGEDSFNALKYCNIYYHADYMKKEQTDGKFQFLGL